MWLKKSVLWGNGSQIRWENDEKMPKILSHGKIQFWFHLVRLIFFVTNIFPRAGNHSEQKKNDGTTAKPSRSALPLPLNYCVIFPIT